MRLLDTVWWLFAWLLDWCDRRESRREDRRQLPRGGRRAEDQIEYDEIIDDSDHMTEVPPHG